MNIALFSSRRLGILPLSRAEKKESEHQVRVDADVEKLKRAKRKRN